MSNLKIVCCVICASALCGCLRSIKIEKNDPVLFETNGVVTVVDGGYSVKYRNIGLKTDVSSIRAKKTENGVEVKIEGVVTDVSSENKEIVSSTGTAVGNVAEKIIDGVKGVETVKSVETKAE